MFPNGKAVVLASVIQMVRYHGSMGGNDVGIEGIALDTPTRTHESGGINVLRKRLADHSRLFANFLENELPTLALLGATVREGGSATVAY